MLEWLYSLYHFALSSAKSADSLYKVLKSRLELGYFTVDLEA